MVHSSQTKQPAQEISSTVSDHPTLDDLTSGHAEEVIQPEVFRDGNNLVLAGGATLPENICVKTGLKVKNEVTLALRNPSKPKTWFSPGGKVTVGLSRQSLETFRIQQAVAYAMLVLGLAMIPVGLFSGLGTALAGLVVSIGALVLRASVPIRADFSNPDMVTVRGCGEPYLALFSEK